MKGGNTSPAPKQVNKICFFCNFNIENALHSGRSVVTDENKPAKKWKRFILSQ